MKTKNAWKPLLPLLSLVVAVSGALATESGHPAPKPNASFDKMKGLVGEWEADGEGGTKIHEQITLTGGGAVLMETMFPGSDHAMVTMYHPDGNTLVATHYCASGNQPRLRSKGLGQDGRTLSFSFADGTNMKPGDMHMDKVQLTLVDADHFDAIWTAKGPDSDGPMTFHWARVASTASAAPAPAPAPAPAK